MIADRWLSNLFVQGPVLLGLRLRRVDGCGCGGGAVTTAWATTGRATPLALFSAFLDLILSICSCGYPFWTPLCTAALQPAVDRLRHLGTGQRHHSDAGMQPRLCREPRWRRRDDHLHQWRLDERGRVLRLEPDPGLTSSACFSRPVQSLTAVLLPIFCSPCLYADVCACAYAAAAAAAAVAAAAAARG